MAHVFSMLMGDFQMFLIVNSMSVALAVPNNIWIIEQHRLIIEVPFYLIVTSIQGVIYFHKHYGVIWVLHSMNMEVLAINYSKNGIIIYYQLPIKVLFHHLSVNIICPVPPFKNHRHCKTPNLSQLKY